MALQIPVAIQKILGAFNPTSGAITGITVSGETPYQNIPNALIATTFAGLRTTATAVGATAVMVMGKNTVNDGLGGVYAFNPNDTTSGCICVGSAAGTVLTVTAVQTGSITVNAFLCSSVTGLVLAQVLSFGSGAGGTGTYNLSAPVNQAGPFTFILDSNGAVLVSTDGSRWASTLTNTTAVPFTLLAPSGNNAIALTTPTYTFGNAIDNPAFQTAGTGRWTFNGGVTTNGGAFNVQATGAADSIENLNAGAGQAVTIFLNSNGRSAGSAALLQQNGVDNLRLKNFVVGGSLILGTSGNDTLTLTNGLFVTGTPGGDPGAGGVNVQSAFVNGIAADSTLFSTSPAAISTVATYIATPLSIPASALQVGNSFRIDVFGQATSSVSNTVNFIPRLGPAGTVADASLGTFTFSSAVGGTNIGFFVSFIVTITAVNAATGATLMSAYIATSGGLFNGTSFAASGNAVGSLNTTQATKLGLSFSTSAATTSAQFFQVIITRLF